MTNFKKKEKKAVKGNRPIWRRGQSSKYNPTFNKNRLAAKKKAAFSNQGLGGLTEEKLRKHNSLLNSKQNDVTEDSITIGGDTAITAFTNCSLPTFNRFMKNWNVKSFLHKEMLAVLAATTDVIRSKGGKETETEYFAALMLTLDVVDTDEALTSVICLLSMVVKSLPPSVLKLNSGSTCETMTKLLIKYMNNDHCALLRNLMAILYNFLKLKTDWKESSDEFSVLLEYTTHSKPKVRKAAQEIVRKLLVDDVPETSTSHPAAIETSKFCIQKLENSGTKPGTTTFHILALLRDVIHVFPKSYVKLCSETILRVMTLSNAMVTSSCLKVFQGLFASSPKSECVPVDLNARIIMALYDYQPNINDNRSLPEWLESMNLAFLNLHSLDAKLCLSHLPKFFQVSVKCWLADRGDAMPTVAYVLKNLLQNCCRPESNAFQESLMEDPVNNYMHRMFYTVEEAMSYQYHKAWKHVLDVLACFFELMGKHCYTVMLKCLRSLADMHDSHRFPYVMELEKTIGVAVHYMGPQIVLRAIPLDISNRNNRPDFPRSWLLPLLRDHIKQTELAFFIDNFLPVAEILKKKALSLIEEGKPIESKLHDVLYSQVWSLLPGFCTEPTDLKQYFMKVSKILCVKLENEPTLRPIILSSLRLLISKNLENEKNISEISRFSKNYLPCLFNLYTSKTKDKAEEKVRLSVYETCKVYLQITDKKLCHKYFNEAMRVLSSFIADESLKKTDESVESPDESDPFLQHALIDLNKALLPFVDEEYFSKIYEYCKVLLNHPNITTQKKCYSIISALCSSESAACQSFMTSHVDELRALLCGSSSGLTPSTRALRLNCLQHIVNGLTESDKECIVAITSEAVLCTKEGSLRARNAAYNLLTGIGNTFIRWNSENANGAIREYMAVLLAGLAGNQHLMSATILAIGRVMYEFKDNLDSDVIHLLVENMCLLLTSKSREVVVSALSFVKILFATMDTMDLAQHVEFMVKNLTSLSGDNQRLFRFKAREIFTRLIRKFGYEMISKLTPEPFQKQLTLVRKLEVRKKKLNKRDQDSESDDEMYGSKRKSDNINDILEETDDEIDLDEEIPSHKAKKQKKSADPVIEERGEDDIADFMDPSISRKILASMPKKPVVKKESSSSSFPISKDGKFIIVDEEEIPVKIKQRDTTQKLTEDPQDLETTRRNQKRKHDDSDEDDVESDTPVVNKGIHRTVKKKVFKKRQPGSEFKSKKAGGDMKKGKVDPYAYLPLNRLALNRRKKVKLNGQFNNIVRGAKKGAAAGRKNKSRQAMRKKKFKK